MRNLVTAPLLAAMMAATSWIAVPLFGPVPVTLQTVFGLLAGLLLSPGWAAASMGLYLALGAVGLPVFAQGQAGLAALLGPTGGFLIAFPFAAAVSSAVFRALGDRKSIAPAVVAVIAAELVIYAIGVPWLMAQTGMSLSQAFAVAVVPFLVPDAIKATFAVALATAIRSALSR
jgi:biotin transport system substrate-specific component